MGAGDVIAGVIAAFMGLAGLADIFGRPILPLRLASIGLVLTPEGALLLFGAMAGIGIALVASGAMPGKREVVVREASVAVPVVISQPGASVVYESLPDLDHAILRYLSQGKSEGEITEFTGVDGKIVSGKIQKLRAEGYLTEKNDLTERGYNALKPIEAFVMTPRNETT
jgi:hypothetical protein